MWVWVWVWVEGQGLDLGALAAALAALGSVATVVEWVPCAGAAIPPSPATNPTPQHVSARMRTMLVALGTFWGKKRLAG